VLFVVIPAWNERANMGPLFADLARRPWLAEARILLVDDGSSDGTAEAARHHARGAPLEVITHEVNRGLGGAVATGLRGALATAADDDAIVTIEGDNTTDLDDLPVMLEAFERGADVVMASFFAPGGRMVGVVRWRVAAAKTLAWLFRTLGGLREFHQVTPLYRVYRAGTLRRAARMHGDALVTESGFGVNVELFIKLRDVGARIVEVPSTIDWTKRQGVSKLPLRATISTYVRLLGSLAARRVRGSRTGLSEPATQETV
jgi:dolichol-phosphate mannosyltransferase